MTAPLQALLSKWPRELDPPIPGRVTVPPSARAVLLAAAAMRIDGPILAVVAGEHEAEDLVDDGAMFSDSVHHLPAWETLPFEHVSPNAVTMAK
ncbi:MAG: hypothetical protein ACR2N7_08595, partial [Acidimicrobiia bacterium]